jgi:hypothetical protein
VPAEAGLTSGHFGDDTYGRGLSAEELTREHRLLGQKQYANMIHVREYGFTPEEIENEWFDFHARLGA